MYKIETLYHYCSVNTFLAIVQDKCIRLSDLNRTNDYMEKRWATKLIGGVLKEELENFDIKIDLTEDYWYEDGVSNHLQYYNKEIKRVFYDTRPILITCFSKEKDSLSQWRAYGQDGEGVSIGFNYKQIKDLKNNCKNISVEMVMYKENKQKEKLAELVHAAILYMKKMFEDDLLKISNDFNEYFTEKFDGFCEVLIEHLEKISCVIKNPAFSEEKEVRIIYDPQLYNNKVTGGMTLEESEKYFKKGEEINKYKISPIKYYFKNNQLVASCDIDFTELIKEQVINEIIIGPKSKITENDIYYFLLSNGYDANSIKISHTEATYR